MASFSKSLKFLNPNLGELAHFGEDLDKLSTDPGPVSQYVYGGELMLLEGWVVSEQIQVLLVSIFFYFQIYPLPLSPRVFVTFSNVMHLSQMLASFFG